MQEKVNNWSFETPTLSSILVHFIIPYKAQNGYPVPRVKTLIYILFWIRNLSWLDCHSLGKVLFHFGFPVFVSLVLLFSVCTVPLSSLLLRTTSFFHTLISPSPVCCVFVFVREKRLKFAFLTQPQHHRWRCSEDRGCVKLSALNDLTPR